MTQGYAPIILDSVDTDVGLSDFWMISLDPASDEAPTVLQCWSRGELVPPVRQVSSSHRESIVFV